jgi:hypothetical protein
VEWSYGSSYGGIIVRNEVKELLTMGPFPSSKQVICSRQTDLVEKYQRLLLSIEKPVTDEEAKALVKLFGVDDFFELEWTLMQLIETAPSWPIEECLKNVESESIDILKDRAERWRNAGYPRRSYYKEVGIPDPRTNQDSIGDGGTTLGENKS